MLPSFVWIKMFFHSFVFFLLFEKYSKDSWIRKKSFLLSPTANGRRKSKNLIKLILIFLALQRVWFDGYLGLSFNFDWFSIHDNFKTFANLFGLKVMNQFFVSLFLLINIDKGCILMNFLFFFFNFIVFTIRRGFFCLPLFWKTLLSVRKEYLRIIKNYFLFKIR